MDVQRFDRLTRQLALAAPRRSVLGLFGGSLLGGLLTERLGEEAAARKRKKRKKKKCRGGTQTCGKRCFDLRTDAEHCGGCTTVCGATEVCVAGQCTCPPGQETCGGECCPPDSCIDGRCSCPAGQVACGGECCATERCIDEACCPANRACGAACCAGGEFCADPATGACVSEQGTCPTGAHSCGAGPVVFCNASSTCICVQSTAGATRCAAAIDDDCGNCETDADCVQLFPNVAGVFCAGNASGVACPCAQGQSICAAPCPA